MSVLKITARFLNKEPSLGKNQETPDYSTLTLPYELRQKSRLRAQLDNGQEVGIILEHGQQLRHGDLLEAENGHIIKVKAASESVSTITTSAQLMRMRACYHLGNRHVPLQIEADWIRYRQDSVLDNMIENLGLSITHENVPFEPESGAYDHTYDHTHGHTHEQ